MVDFCFFSVWIPFCSWVVCHPLFVTQPTEMHNGFDVFAEFATWFSRNAARSIGKQDLRSSARYFGRKGVTTFHARRLWWFFTQPICRICSSNWIISTLKIKKMVWNNHHDSWMHLKATLSLCFHSFSEFLPFLPTVSPPMFVHLSVLWMPCNWALHHQKNCNKGWNNGLNVSI